MVIFEEEEEIAKVEEIVFRSSIINAVPGRVHVVFGSVIIDKDIHLGIGLSYPKLLFPQKFTDV